MKSVPHLLYFILSLVRAPSEAEIFLLVNWAPSRITFWTIDDLLNIDNNFFDSMVNRIYPSELQLNKANVSDIEVSFLDLHLSLSDGFVKTRSYDKWDGFDFDIVNFTFLDNPMVFVFLILFDLLDCPVILMTLILVIRFWQQNFSDKDIDIIKFVRRFQNFIGGILT